MIAAELRGGNKPSLNEALRWIGSRVDDIYGVSVGRLEDVWIDPGTGAPRWLLVKEGRFGGRTTLIPFEDATAGAGHVWVPYEREIVRQAPEIEPGAPLTQQVEAALRSHYAANVPAAISHGGRDATVPQQPEDPNATIRISNATGRGDPAPEYDAPGQAPNAEDGDTAYQSPASYRTAGQEPHRPPPATPRRRVLREPSAPQPQPYRPAPMPERPAPPVAAPPQYSQAWQAPEQQYQQQQPPPQQPQYQYQQQPPPPRPQEYQQPQQWQPQPPPYEPPRAAPTPIETLTALAGSQQSHYVEIELSGQLSIRGELRSVRVVPRPQ